MIMWLWPCLMYSTVRIVLNCFACLRTEVLHEVNETGILATINNLLVCLFLVLLASHVAYILTQVQALIFIWVVGNKCQFFYMNKQNYSENCYFATSYYWIYTPFIFHVNKETKPSKKNLFFMNPENLICSKSKKLSFSNKYIMGNAIYSKIVFKKFTIIFVTYIIARCLEKI